MSGPFEDPTVKSVVSWLIAALLGVFVWLVNRQTKKVDENTKRITAIESRLVDRGDLREVYDKMDELKMEFINHHNLTREYVEKWSDETKDQHSDILNELRKLNE